MGRIISSVHLVLDCVDLRARFLMEQRKDSWTCRESNHVFYVVQLIACSRELNFYENGFLFQLLVNWDWIGSGMHVMVP